jgi:hypothetical protein
LIRRPGYRVDLRADRRTIKDADDPLKNADFAKLRWRTPLSTEALTVQTFRLVLQETGVRKWSENEWNELLKRLKVQLDEPDELSFPVQTK